MKLTKIPDPFRKRERERLDALTAQVAELAQVAESLIEYQGLTVRDIGGGVFDVVKRTSGAGTEGDPYDLTFPVEAQPNAFYAYDGRVYVYMGVHAQTEAALTDDFVEADWL